MPVLPTVDRAVAEQTLRAWPSIRISARENRAFIGRAVRYLAGEAGVTQFLDIGSGCRPLETCTRSCRT